MHRVHPSHDKFSGKVDIVVALGHKPEDDIPLH